MDFYQEKYSFHSSQLDNSETWGKGTLTIPLFEGLNIDEQDYIICILENEIAPMIGLSENV